MSKINEKEEALIDKYGDILIEEYDHPATHDFWCVMVETGIMIIRYYYDRKGPFTYTGTIPNGQTKFPHKNLSMGIERDLAKIFGFDFNIDHKRGWYIISRDVTFTDDFRPCWG